MHGVLNLAQARPQINILPNLRFSLPYVFQQVHLYSTNIDNDVDLGYMQVHLKFISLLLYNILYM